MLYQWKQEETSAYPDRMVFLNALRLHAQDVIYTQVVHCVFLRFIYTLENVSKLNQTCEFQCQIFCAATAKYEVIYH